VRWQVSARDVVLVSLTLGSGGVDAVCFFGLGQVFTSVMTGNLVLFGLAVGRGEGFAALHSAVALIGYAIAAFAAARWLPKPAGGSQWPGRATMTLAGELALLIAAAATWLASGGHPAGTTQYLLIVAYALAMGTQSATVHALAIPGMSTTYVTGTLTWVLTTLAHRCGEPGHIARRLTAVASVAVGAACSSLLLLFAPVTAALFPLAAAGVAAATAAVAFPARTESP
jgi:uncharacterized membrane protein YoaK (UPF0700 family)